VLQILGLFSPYDAALAQRFRGWISAINFEINGVPHDLSSV
jgi:hypothetical protein